MDLRDIVQLTPAGSAALKDLCRTSHELHLRPSAACSSSAMLAAVHERCAAIERSQEEQRRLGAEISAAEDEMRDAETAVAALQAAIASAAGELSRAVPLAEETAVLQERGAQHRAEAARSRKSVSVLKKLADAGASVRHADLISLQSEVERLERCVGDRERQLASFRGLPPDAALAGLEVEAVRKKAQALEAELQARLDRMAGCLAE